MNKLFLWVSSTRPDVTWMKGNNWDESLPNQQEIIDLVNSFEESWEPIIVPEIVTPRQLKTSLVLNGISLSQVDSAIATLSDPDKTIVAIAWEYAVEFERSHPFILQLAPLIGLTQEQVDSIFIQAASL